MNLLQETKIDIAGYGYTPEDIVFIGGLYPARSCNWEKFCELADREYDCGFGSQEVNSDLLIVFSDGSQMRRIEYDGSEGWEFIGLFVEPENAQQMESLFYNGY